MTKKLKDKRINKCHNVEFGTLQYPTHLRQTKYMHIWSLLNDGLRFVRILVFVFVMEFGRMSNPQFVGLCQHHLQDWHEG